MVNAISSLSIFIVWHPSLSIVVPLIDIISLHHFIIFFCMQYNSVYSSSFPYTAPQNGCCAQYCTSSLKKRLNSSTSLTLKSGASGRESILCISAVRAFTTNRAHPCHIVPTRPSSFTWIIARSKWFETSRTDIVSLLTFHKLDTARLKNSSIIIRSHRISFISTATAHLIGHNSHRMIYVVARLTARNRLSVEDRREYDKRHSLYKATQKLNHDSEYRAYVRATTF